MKSEIEFRAETFRIIGLALMSPFGRLFLDPAYVIEHYIFPYSMLYVF